MTKDSNIFERRFAAVNSVIMREGEPGNCAYLVQSGRVVVFTEHDGQQIELARLGVGEIFGEMALAADIPRSASVKAIEDCNLIVITRDVLTKKLSRSDSTVQAIVKMLIRRMQISNEALVRKKTNLKEMAKSARESYKSIYETLPASQRSVFESGVKPKLDEFLTAVEAFDMRFPKT